MIPIIDNWYLDSDDRQYLLIDWDGRTRIDKKTGIETPQINRTYFIGTLENVFRTIMEVSRRRSVAKATTMREYFKLVQAETRRLEAALAKFAEGIEH